GGGEGGGGGGGGAGRWRGTGYAWMAGGGPTNQARIRAVALDGQGVLGYDASDAVFVLAGSMLAPNDVGDTLEVYADATDLILSWKRPAADSLHGPVDHYVVMRSFTPNGPFAPMGTTAAETYRDPMAGTSG